MAVLEFKPKRLSYLVSENGYEDENGDYHSGESRWEGEIECGTVPAGKANEIKFDDGTVKVYSYTVYLPSDCRDFEIGDRVRIKALDGRDREFEVISFHRYQLQCKMWV